jgi:hypothetical protein
MKIRNTRYEIRNTKILFAVAILVLLISYLVSPSTILAQESSASGSLLQKLTELKQDIASKAAQIKTEMTKKVQNKAIIGTILDKRSTEITINTLNSVKIVKYDEFTEVIGSKGKTIKADTLEANDNIAALGDVDDKNNLVAQRLVYLETPATISAQLIYGQIQKVSGQAITIKSKDGQTQNILTNPQTAFFLGNQEASLLDAKVEKYLATRATKQKDGTLRARFIYFIPSTGFTKPTKDSSPSAKIK